jgi:hypothetical protein
VFNHPAPRLGGAGRYVDRRHFIQEEQLGELLGVDPVVLACRAEDQAELPRMGHDDPPGDPPQPLNEKAITRRGFEADRQGPRELRQLGDPRGPWSLVRPCQDLATPIIQDTEGRLS